MSIKSVTGLFGHSMTGAGGFSLLQGGETHLMPFKAGRGYLVNRVCESAWVWLEVLVVVVCVCLGSGQARELCPPFGPVRVEVTGDPTPVDTLRQAIAAAARMSGSETGVADVAVVATTPPLQPLQTKSEVCARAVVRLAAVPGALAFQTLSVTMTNVTIPLAEAEVLLVSNSPETVRSGQVLLSAPISAGRPARLLYHHLNGLSIGPMVVVVELSNPDPTPLRLWIAGAAHVGTDELAVGHAAAREFLDQYWHRAGFVQTVPGNRTLQLVVQELAPREIASGLEQIRILDGVRATVRVVAQVEGETNPAAVEGLADADLSHQRGVFDRPLVARRGAYALGGPFLIMDVGDAGDALRDLQTHTMLNGNYGVLYRFQVGLNNPSAEAAVMGLVLQARAGDVSSTLLIDGQMVDLPRVKSGDSRVLTKVRLAPGRRRSLAITTMPESGGSYPARLIFGAPVP